MVTIEDNKINPAKKIITDLKIQVIYIPLETALGVTYKKIVSVGDYVCIGSPLATSTSSEEVLSSSISGVVVGFEKKYISTAKLVECIVIENDFKEKYLNKVGTKNDITKYTQDEFIFLLQQGGIVGMSGSGFPTYIKYDKTKNLKYLIVDGAECEAYASADSAIMYNHPEEILEAIDAIMEIMHFEYAYIAINEKNDKVIKKFLKYINTYPNIKIYPLLDGYPNGYERYLVKEILNLEYDKYPFEVGVINENVSTIYAIYEVLKYHRPLSERVVTLSGPGIKHPSNYKLKIGTNLSEIFLKTDEYKTLEDPLLIAGGAMMGKSIPSEELIITKNLNCILVLPNNNSCPQECLKCGKCTEVCPRNLIPSMIIDKTKNLPDLSIDKCILCGLCSYVCPSKIEVRDIIKNIKEGHDERI